MAAEKGVLFVSGTLEVGGSETKVVRLANALVRAGRRVGLAYLSPPEALLDQVHSSVTVMHLARRGKYSFGSLRRLRGAVARGYSVLISVNFYPLLYILPAVKLAARGGCKSVALVNTTEFVDRQWIWGRVYAPFLRRCDYLVYGCRAQQHLWTEKYRLPVERSRVIYNGVDRDRFSGDASNGQAATIRGEHSIPAGAVVFGSIGRLAPEKNFDLLIRAVADLNSRGREAWLLLVGDGSEKAALQAVAESAGIKSRVMFTGILGDVRPALSAMDVFVLPSRAVETFSNAALEAMAMSRPVVLSDIGGAAEMIEDGRSGYLFPAGDRQRLRDILLRLYDSKSTRVAVGQSARQRVLDNFGFDGMLNEYKELLASAMG